MKILETLNNEDLSWEEKLKAVKSFVKMARAEYGNEDAEITPVKVNSVNGMVAVNLLSTCEKVAVSDNEIRHCISHATAVTDNVEGAVFDRAFEYAVSTNPVLVSIGMKSDSKY